ncbi:ABC transporter permease [Actinophytocola gossypii]|uniref:Transport permease protein n=1 Tax=Actinophytocola gossypii TaxID=2812003 RepID=A0ABT2JI28_9PSEU|nr:ABC transporter permease [Actinophytocola gossypii]MCT2587533.1 ABC transporter permease [Actinophytocola gossypii]
MTTAVRERSRFAISLRTFGNVLWRDIFVTGRELVPFLAQVILQPFFMLFIFGKVLTNLGYVGDDFTAILLPGIIALNGFLAALQNTTLPLVMDFSWTREIEDRLLAPMPIPLVAVEKMVFGALRGIIAAVVMVPIGFLILPGVSWPASALLPVTGILVLGSLAGAAIGMTIGTLVTPRRINIMFAVILTPLMFTGSTQFPWRGLTDLGWFQVLCALNPLTYVSEGMRALLVPSVDSIPLWVDIPVILAACAVFGAIGIKGFMHRALD